MNIRQKTILFMLLQGENKHIEELSNKFSVSNKTIRNDLKYLDDFLKEKENEPSIRFKDGIYSIEGPKNLNIDKLLNDLDYYISPVSAEERYLLILADLCMANDFVTISDLCEKYYVSRSTINSDLVLIKEYTQKQGINFVSERGRGLAVVAEEKDKRKYLSTIINDCSSIVNHSYEDRLENYVQWFSKETLEQIHTILLRIEQKHHIYLSDIAFENLTIHIALAIKRYEEGSTIEPYNEKGNIQSPQYLIAQSIVNEINNYFKIELPKQEIEYISVHLGSKSSHVLMSEGLRNAKIEYYSFELIRRIGERVNGEIIYDEILFESIYQHLLACQYRVINKIKLQNPLKNELMKSYSFLFEVIREVISQLKIQNIIEASDDEIGYILIHIATSLQRKTKEIKLLNVLLVCGTGLGTAELLKENLKKNFDFNYVGNIAKHQIRNFLLSNQVDLIITTVQLDEEYDSILVSPLVNKNDIIKISKVIYEKTDSSNFYSKKLPKSRTAIEIEKVLLKYGNIEDEEKLVQKVKTILVNQEKEESETVMLSDLLQQQTINIKVGCKTWQEAIQSAGNCLINNDSIDQTYVDECIKNVEELGPYIVITKGIALPHAFNSKGVYQTCLSLVTLEKPVNFGSTSNDPVHSVFMLATTDATSHLSALSDLSEYLGRKEFIDILKTGSCAEEIIKYIQENEKK